MATKAKSSSKARSAKTTRTASGAAARTTKKSTVVKSSATVSQPVRRTSYRIGNDLTGSQVLSEMLGTFLFVLTVAATGGNAFLVGISLIVLTATFYRISGAHVNPAVTFGLWAMRKVSAVKMVFYWMAQFVGAIAAILITTAFSGSKLNISLASFGQWDWRVVFAELIGTAIFMFGIAAAARYARSDSERGLGVGLTLFVALLLSGSMLQQASSAASADTASKQSNEVQRITKLNGTTLNPAVALGQSETDSSNVNPLTGEAQASNKTTASRLTMETIVATLVGAAIGGRLYMLLVRGTSREEYK